MTAVDRLVGEFVDAWNAGARPDVLAFLDRAAPAERDDLAVRLQAWLDVAPTPELSSAAAAQVAAEPLLVAALAAAAAERASVAERVPALRARAGLRLRDVAERLSERFALGDADRAEAYLERLEADALDERRLSRRLLVALTAILGAQPGALVPAAGPAGQTFFRTTEDADRWVLADLEVLSDAALAAAPADPLDDLDRLFVGGPDG